jgi:hypothetical protein
MSGDGNLQDVSRGDHRSLSFQKKVRPNQLLRLFAGKSSDAGQDEIQRFRRILADIGEVSLERIQAFQQGSGIEGGTRLQQMGFDQAPDPVAAREIESGTFGIDQLEELGIGSKTDRFRGRSHARVVYGL